MPVPTSINDLSTTESSNSPATTESPGDGDNYIRAYGAFIASLRDMLNGTGSATQLIVVDGSATGQTDNAGADSIVIDGTGNTGIGFLGSTTSIQQILFGDTGSNNIGGLTYLHESDTIRLTANGGRLSLTSSTATFSSGVAVSADSFTGAVTVGTSGGNVFASTYTPTITNITNVDSSTARLSNYMRVGNMVWVAGQCDVDPTSTGITTVEISLPIASDLTTEYQLSGTANAGGLVSGLTVFSLKGDATDNRAILSFDAGAVGNHNFSFVFMYQVL